MSVQASLNIAGVVANTKAVSNTPSTSDTTGLGKENQLFSGILSSVSNDSAEQLSAPANGAADDIGEFVGPAPPDNGLSTFSSEANLGELEGKLLPLLPGVISGFNLDQPTPVLGGKIELTTSVQLQAGSNAVLEQLRGLLTGASEVGDSEEVIELRARLVSLLDSQQSNVKQSAEQVLGNPILSDQTQTSLRQEVSATLNSVRGAFNDYFDRMEKMRSGDFFNLSPSFFETAQKKAVNLDDLLAALTKPNTASADNSANVNTNTILSQINSLLSGNTAIGQPLLNAVADTGSLQSSNPTQTQVTAPLNSSQWSEELGQRVRWLVGQNINAAQIRLNPAELGPVELRINVSGDQVSVAFTSQFGAVREAIESAIPKLREMLENQGLNLADADINQGDSAERQSEEGTNTSSNSDLALVGTTEGELVQTDDSDTTVVELSSSSLVDQFV